MKERKYKYYIGSGHGWMAVPFKDIKEGFMSFVFPSEFSYLSENGKTVYLEEDCDMPKFLDFLKNNGYSVKIEDIYGNKGERMENHIRNLKHFYMD